MRYVLITVPILLLATTLSLLAEEATSAVAMLTGMQGEVELLRKGATTGSRSVPQQLLYEGDILQVGEDAFAEVFFFADGRAERLAAGSKAEVGRNSIAVRAGAPPDVVSAGDIAGSWATLLRRSAEYLKLAPGQRRGLLLLRGAKPKWLTAAVKAARLLGERGAHCTHLLLEGVAYYEANIQSDARSAFEEFVSRCESSPLIHRVLARLYELEAARQHQLADTIEEDQLGKR